VSSGKIHNRISTKLGKGTQGALLKRDGRESKKRTFQGGTILEELEREVLSLPYRAFSREGNRGNANRSPQEGGLRSS